MKEIIIGKQNINSYLGVITLASKSNKEFCFKARGKMIGKLTDVLTCIKAGELFLFEIESSKFFWSEIQDKTCHLRDVPCLEISIKIKE